MLSWGPHSLSRPPHAKEPWPQGSNTWSVQRSTGNNQTPSNPLSRHLARLCSQRTVPWWGQHDWQTRDWKIHSWWRNKASPRRRFPTIQLPNWGLSVTCESNLLWELESWFCLNGTTNMHHFCEFNGWPTCFFPAYWVSDVVSSENDTDQRVQIKLLGRSWTFQSLETISRFTWNVIQKQLLFLWLMKCPCEDKRLLENHITSHHQYHT